MPAFAYMKTENTVFVNFYCESEATVKLEADNEVFIQQKTTYPENDKIILEIDPKKSREFEVALRIPEWSEKTSLTINGDSIKNLKAGTYKRVKRAWKKGDRIELQLDLRGRLVKQNSYQAITRGPIVLARDTRFADGFVDETAIVQSENGIVKLTPTQKIPNNIWMAFTAPLVLGTDLEGEFKNPQKIIFCDFGSAGNTWEPGTRYR